jgi:hypothetical protein
MKAPREIPWNMRLDFTLGQRIPVVDYYFNNASVDNNAVFSFTTGAMCFQQTFWDPNNIENLIQKVSSREPIGYLDTTAWLYQALDNHPIRGKSVVIIGSEQPTYECVALGYEGNPTTIEYKKINCTHPGITTYTPTEHDSLKDQVYDCCFSISSLEHDGLGRYGDPLNPYADIETMKRLKNLVRKDGLLFLSVPIGSDILYWNGMRQYGDIRFPLLTEGWKVIDTFGYNDGDFVKKYGKNPQTGHWAYHQPVFVLQNVG